MTFAAMVPITILAFTLGSTFVTTIAPLYWSDYVALTLTFFGVFFYNYFDEKPQKTSIENI